MCASGIVIYSKQSQFIAQPDVNKGIYFASAHSFYGGLRNLAREILMPSSKSNYDSKGNPKSGNGFGNMDGKMKIKTAGE